MEQRFCIEEDSIRGKRRGLCLLVREQGKEVVVGGTRSQDGPRPRWEQLAPELVQIGERKHGLRPGQILSQTAVSDLGKTPQLLDHRNACSPQARVRERA